MLTVSRVRLIPSSQSYGPWPGGRRRAGTEREGPTAEGESNGDSSDLGGEYGGAAPEQEMYDDGVRHLCEPRDGLAGEDDVCGCTSPMTSQTNCCRECVRLTRAATAKQTLRRGNMAVHYSKQGLLSLRGLANASPLAPSFSRSFRHSAENERHTDHLTFVYTGH